jgi:hypothetical protein
MEFPFLSNLLTITIETAKSNDHVRSSGSLSTTPCNGHAANSTMIQLYRHLRRRAGCRSASDAPAAHRRMGRLRARRLRDDRTVSPGWQLPRVGVVSHRERSRHHGNREARDGRASAGRRTRRGGGHEHRRRFAAAPAVPIRGRGAARDRRHLRLRSRARTRRCVSARNPRRECRSTGLPISSGGFAARSPPRSATTRLENLVWLSTAEIRTAPPALATSFRQKRIRICELPLAT